MQEQVTVQQRVGQLDLSHRYRLEQRWIGKFAKAESTSPESYTYMNRFRHMLRAQMPLQGPTLDNREFYAAASDEVFIGFGKNVQENIFDQNRLYLLAGYQFSKHFRLEGGYFQQVLQFTREIKGSNVSVQQWHCGKCHFQCAVAQVLALLYFYPLLGNVVDWHIHKNAIAACLYTALHL